MENKVLDVKGVIDFKTLEQQMTPKPIKPTETEIANEIRVNKIHNENKKIAIANGIDPVSFENAVFEMTEILLEWDRYNWDWSDYDNIVFVQPLPYLSLRDILDEYADYYGWDIGGRKARNKIVQEFEEIIYMNDDQTFLRMARKIVLNVWVKDTDGKVYINERAMCKARNIDYEIYLSRKGRGWDLDKILNEEKRKMSDRNTLISEATKKFVNENGLIEFRGETYKTIKDLCWRYWQQDSTVYSGLRKGRTLEEALFDKGNSQYEKIVWNFLDDVLKGTTLEFYRDRTIKCLLRKMKNKNACDNLSASESELMLGELLDDKYFKTTDRILAMRIDFLIVQGNKPVAFIEYDGIQHYNEQSYLSLRRASKGGTHNGTYKNLSDEEFIERLKIADKKKDEFAKIMGVPILRITAKKEDVIRTLIDSFLKANNITICA